MFDLGLCYDLMTVAFRGLRGDVNLETDGFRNS
jgi:hypothetical protein